MQLHDDGTLVVSATDLVGFLECDHLVTLEELRARGELEKPIRNDPELELVRRRGYEHEALYIETLREQGRTVVEMTSRDPRTPAELHAAEAETLAAMRAGTDVIFQGTFFDGRWRGHPDFLLRRDDRPSDLGSWSYDVADTKLAKRVKAAAILQMCVYADQLARLQGIPPETISVVTGDRQAHPHRLDDYAAYYRSAKRRFEERVFETAAGDAPPTYPEPVDHCRVCSWWIHCMDRRRADDHLSLVAGAARTQRRALTGAGVTTLAGLAALPEDRAVRDVRPRILDRLRRQAILQRRAREEGRVPYELIPPNPDEPGKGLSALPPPSRLDVFFDIEADPWALDDGLEYLFGWVERGPDGEPVFHALWAHDRAEEKRMLEAFVDLVLERRERDPGMHVYHYGGYESGALKRLMQRHATREDEIDVLLRGHVLVNLYDHVVRQGVRAGVESYSIKKLETFYMPQREGGITQAGFSVVEYERWMAEQDPAILDAIAAYNRDDCISNLLLRDWLEGRRDEALETHPEWYPDGAVPRPTWEDGAPGPKVAEDQAETRAREDALRVAVPEDRLERTPEQQGRWLLAALLDWHRRENKPQWWDHFRLVEAPIDDLVADGSALAELRFDADLGRIDRSALHRYRFDPAQDSKVLEGKSYLALAPNGDGSGWDASTVKVITLDPVNGLISLKRNAGDGHPVALIPTKPFGTEPMRGALGRLADHVAAHGIEGPGRFQAARDLIMRRPPRIEGLAAGAELAPDGADVTLVARDLGLRLDETVLAIQGPPGTGKTYTAARMILDLVDAGKRVGVTAQSHRVIANLLESVQRAAAEERRFVRIGQRFDGEDDTGDPFGIERIPKSDAVARRPPRRVVGRRRRHVVGVGTRRPRGMRSTCCSSTRRGSCRWPRCARWRAARRRSSCSATRTSCRRSRRARIPRARPRPRSSTSWARRRPSRPTAACCSARRTASTRRSTPSSPTPSTRAGSRPTPAPRSSGSEDGLPIGGSGIRHVPVRTTGASNRSREEAAWIADAVAALRGRRWVNQKGDDRPLEVDDIIIVAPYNAQVAEIGRVVKERIGIEANVGTVDKFQGREGAVAIYSMTTSTPEDAPRGMEFLYSGNRLNVAVSRARALAVVIANPELFHVACHTPEQMRMLNAFCRLLEVAAAQDPRRDRHPRGGSRAIVRRRRDAAPPVPGARPAGAPAHGRHGLIQRHVA